MDHAIQYYLILGFLVVSFGVISPQVDSIQVENNSSIQVEKKLKLKYFQEPELYEKGPIFGPGQIAYFTFNFSIGNITNDLLQTFAEVIYKGDGTGVIEIIFNLLPIVGNNSHTDALLYPIFLILFAGGVYTMLKRRGLIA